MVPQSLLCSFAACLLFTTSLAAPAPAPAAHAQPAAEAAPVHVAEHKAARYAKGYIYERRQVPTHPTQTLKERDVGAEEEAEATQVEDTHSDHARFPSHPYSWRHGSNSPSSPKPSSGFSLPAIQMKERRDAPYSYFDKRDSSAFAYPDHGYEKRESNPSPGRGSHWGVGPALPVPSSGFHLPQWPGNSHNGPYSFGSDPRKASTSGSGVAPRGVKAPTHVHAARNEGMPRYAMGY
ncbi:MAG: hypothetical protein M1831_001076 [Alyxoria varia]|nr:MAG: hypothetical protein M1831_001076 [Alyxoria varia]